MTAEIGQIALILALLAALYQGVIPLVGTQRRDPALAAAGRPAALLQAGFVLLAFAALTVAHASSDFSVRNVFENSHTTKPFIYKFTGVWGNHEGSMVLWALILAVYGAALAAARTTPLRARALAVQGLVAAAFLLFILFTSNPFERVFPVPQDGLGLNPLLQDPALAIHPPFLYLGYVGFSLVFAFAVAGLIEGRIDERWARETRPWALAAWTFLTIGIALGSWWAYYELGWGGFWAWDPVENASFMPWLAGTALIHSLRVTETRGGFRAWTALLAILAFSLSLVGTFLVRSGLLTSVHSFAVDPERGVFILAILAVATGGALALYAWRGPQLGEGARFSTVSRESGLLANNVIISASLVTVFVGTFYPLFVEVMSGDRISVGAPYFNAVYLPFMALTLLIIGPAAALSWKNGRLGDALRRVWPASLAGLAIALIALWLAWPKPVAAALGAGLAVWAGGGVLIDFVKRVRSGARRGSFAARVGSLPRPYLGMTIAHLGLAITAIGVIGAGVWRTEVVAFVPTGESVRVGAYDATLTGVREGEGPNYLYEAATFDIAKNDRFIRTIEAERRFYPVRGMQTTEAGIWTAPLGDLYFTVGEEQAGRGRVVRAWYNPFAAWMWAGSGLMALGGAVAAAPARARRRVAAKETSGVAAAGAA